MAAFFYIHGGANTNFSTIGNWSATSGGGSNGAAPTTTSDVTFDGAGANGNDACVITASPTILSLTFTSGYTNTVTINTTVNVSTTNFTDNTAHSWTVNGTGTMTFPNACTITSGGKTFPAPVHFQGSTAKTLAADWTITGALIIDNLGPTLAGAFTLSCAGLTVTAGQLLGSGGSIVRLTGGTWTGTSLVTTNITFDGSSTVSGTVFFNTGTLLWTSGTITTTSSTLTLSNSCTLNTNGITWNNVTMAAGSPTFTINSLFSATGTMAISIQTITFAGTAGWTVGTLSDTRAATGTRTLQNGNTYTITTSFQCFSSSVGSIVLWTSSHATNTTALILQAGAICSVLANATRIDSSGGRVINSFHGVLTTTTNWFSYTDYGGGQLGSYLFC